MRRGRVGGGASLGGRGGWGWGKDRVVGRSREGEGPVIRGNRSAAKRTTGRTLGGGGRAACWLERRGDPLPPHTHPALSTALLCHAMWMLERAGAVCEGWGRRPVPTEEKEMRDQSSVILLPCPSPPPLFSSSRGHGTQRWPRLNHDDDAGGLDHGALAGHGVYARSLGTASVLFRPPNQSPPPLPPCTPPLPPLAPLTGCLPSL